MKTNRLEEYIRKNRGEFDQHIPSPEVWENISKATNKSKKVRLKTTLLRVAAVFAIILATAALLTQTNLLTPEKYASKSIDPELRELIEAEAFYAQQVNGKLKEIRKCYYTFPELKEEVETDLMELEEMYNVLRQDLKENISNKAVIEAMINNNRNRLQLVDDVLEQIKC